MWLLALVSPVAGFAACSLLTPTGELVGGSEPLDGGALDASLDVAPQPDAADAGLDACDDHFVPTTCGDHKQSGGETDVDCGGDCCRCADGRKCAGGADCTSGVCFNGACAAPACGDQIQNGAETDVDCGGGVCPPCPDAPDAGKCKVDSDCARLNCQPPHCAAPSCTDGKKDGKESDVDCGGPTGAGGAGAGCKKCPFGKLCGAPIDCESAACAADPGTSTPVCQSCPDGKKNGNETDVDCGGGGTCPKCGVDAGCKTMSDCSSGKCINKGCAP